MPFETVPPQNSDFKKITDHTTLWATIEKRFGRVETLRIRAALRNAWLTDADMERIRSAGLNSVRVPFLYDLLDEPDGFSWLDRVIEWAGRRGIYVILDLHGAPGRQSEADHTGEVGVNRLFADATMVERTEDVWAKVARRYKDRPEVAGYDLLNEPMGAKGSASLYELQDRLYKAVRAVDARHIIFVEDGFTGVDRMPQLPVKGWRNVVYSAHIYCFRAKREKDHLECRKPFVSKIRKKQKECPVPFYVGEFNMEPHGEPATVASFVKILERHGWSWSLWTYKVAMNKGSGTKSLWGWFRNPQPIREPIDPFRDSEDDLLRKIEQVKTEHMTEHKLLGRVLARRGLSNDKRASLQHGSSGSRADVSVDN
jgi:hypothetical protein